jgi:hypothetical protein
MHDLRTARQKLKPFISEVTAGGSAGLKKRL